MPVVSRLKAPKRNPVLDWDEFKDCQTRICVRGTDFVGDIEVMQHRARHAAERRGMKAITWTEDGNVFIQFHQI